MATNAAPIIIVKKKKGGHAEAHHGGAWKVAYADFVTAMMAFFLLLWLLNSTTQEQRSGISNYFSAASVARTTSGAGGLLGGQTITLDGPQRGKGAPLGVPEPMPNKSNDGTDSDQQDRINSGPSDFQSENPDDSGKTNDPTAAKNKPTEEQLKALMRKREDKMFEKAQEAIEKTLETIPGLRKLVDHLILESTEEGLRIQIIDRDKKSMFATGSSVPYQHTRQLLEVVAHVVANLPNKISIAGHTDAVPYARGASYSNWELSTDRAHASRRELSRFGIHKERFSRIVGKAATEPLITDKPRNARNRRISITLQRQNRLPPKAAPNLRPNAAPSKPVKKAAVPPPPVVKGAKLKKVIPSEDTPGR